jgi:glycosyltransferase involved in cell wall biosynthesis
LGGAEKSLLDLLRCLDREKYHPIVSCPAQGRFVEELRKIGVTTEIIPYHRKIIALSRGNGADLMVLPLFFWLLTPTILALKKLINNRGIHLIVTNGIKCHFIGAFLSLVTKAQLIWHVRDFIERSWLQWTLRSMGVLFPDKIVTNSNAVGNIFSGHERKETVYNGIDLSYLNPDIDGVKARRSELGVRRDAKLIGTIGHFAPLKGYAELIEAIGEVVGQGFDIKLAVVGDAIYPHSNSYKQKLLSLVDSNGLKDRVIFTGFREDIPEILASFDILVLPSRSEGFGRVNLEAMAMGKPVISTKIGGIPEVVLDGVTGILVPPRDSKALSHAVTRLLNDSHLRESMGQEGRRRVEEHFTLQAHVQRIERIYADVLKEA